MVLLRIWPMLLGSTLSRTQEIWAAFIPQNEWHKINPKVSVSCQLQLPSGRRLTVTALQHLNINSKWTQALPVSDPPSLALKEQCLFVKGSGYNFHLNKLTSINTCFCTKRCTGDSTTGSGGSSHKPMDTQSQEVTHIHWANFTVLAAKAGLIMQITNSGPQVKPKEPSSYGMWK